MDRREAGGTEHWLGRIEEVVRLTAPPASAAEICEQGLARIAEAIGARRGVIVTRGAPGAPPEVAAIHGPDPADDLVRAAVAAFGSESRSATGPLVIPMRLTGVAAGAIAVETTATPAPAALAFLRSATQVLEAALRAARSAETGRMQGELLALRNVELEALRDIGAALQTASTDEEILGKVLDLVVDRLGLEAGWIFWGEESRGRLELAASRGISEEFARRARAGGISPCLCRDVFETGRLAMARNTVECPRLPELLGGEGARTHACIPLKFERGILGVLNVANRPATGFTRRELEFLETVGTQACLAVDKLRTARAEARRNAESRALASLAEEIGGSLDPERVLAAVADDTRRLLGFDRCAIFLGDEENGLTLARLSGSPLEGLEVGGGVPIEGIGSRALPEVLRARRPVVIEDAARDLRSNPDLARRWNVGSAVLLPLATRGRVAGVLHASRARAGAFPAEDIALAGALAAQAAVALESARAYRETREALLRLQEAQDGMMRAERLAAVGTLASSLAHEVRNPLNSITLTLVLLTRGLARQERSDPALGSMVENVRREVERLDALVGDFLSLATLDRLQPEQADPRRVVHEALALLRPLAAAQGIDVRETGPADAPIVSLDRRKVTQVLLNLARNAIDAMPQGGVLTVTVRPGEEGIVIEVADTGVGIDPDLDVFSFFTSTKRGGTGLGLPISRGIVEAHGGRLSYESERGRGTIFRVFLPGARSERVRGAEGT